MRRLRYINVPYYLHESSTSRNSLLIDVKGARLSQRNSEKFSNALYHAVTMTSFLCLGLEWPWTEKSNLPAAMNETITRQTDHVVTMTTVDLQWISD